VAFGAGDRTFVTGSSDGQVRLWETATGKLLGTAQHKVVVGLPSGFKDFVRRGIPGTMAVLPPGGEGLALGAALDLLRLPQIIAAHGYNARVLAVAFSPDGRTILTGGSDKLARLWDGATLKPVGHSIPKQEGQVRTVAYSPVGKYLLTVSKGEKRRGEAAVQVWDTFTGSHVAGLPHHYWVRAVAFSPDGLQVLTGSLDHTAQLWDVKRGMRSGPPLSHQDTVNAVAFSPDGKILLTGSDDRTARLWDAETGKPIGQPLEHQGPVNAVAFSPDGRTLLTAGGDHMVRLWRPAAALPYLREFAHEAQVMAVAFSPDGRTLVTGTDNEKAWRWLVSRAERPLAPLGDKKTGHKDDVWVVAFSPDGRTILTGSRDKTVRLWDATTGTLRHTIRLAYRVRSAAFRRDGQAFLAEGRDRGTKEARFEARFWDTTTLKPVGGPLGVQGVVWQVAVSPDGRTCAIASGENTVQVWDLADGRSWTLTPAHQNRVVALAFSPDGQKLLTGSTDTTARFWDTQTGRPLGEPLQHNSAVWGVAFCADGQTVVTGDRDGNAHFWDTATGTPIGPALQHRGIVWSVACHPRAPLALTASADRTARLWQIPKPAAGDSGRITLWVQVITGMELDNNGAAHWLDAATWKQRRQRLQELGGARGVVSNQWSVISNQ
jgi:WD40 repeat protein